MKNLHEPIPPMDIGLMLKFYKLVFNRGDRLYRIEKTGSLQKETEKASNEGLTPYPYDGSIDNAIRFIYRL